MTRVTRLRSLVLGLLALPALAGWETVGPGVDYQRFSGPDLPPMHVARVDLTNPWVRVVSSMETERGIRTSEFARRNNAIVAVNGDFFTDRLDPVGLSVGPCGPWPETCDRGEGVVATATSRVEIYPPADRLQPPPDWIESAVSGWPMVVRDCRALSSKELPGSDRFTHTPHARTAVGVSNDKQTLYIVVAEGGEGRGVTLAQLSEFMRTQLEVCQALNLDGGGSSVMLLHGQVVAAPRDGAERRVANHLAVVDVRNYPGCTEAATAQSSSRTASRTRR